MAWRPLHVEASGEARRLEEAAAALRRHGGSLRYHPATGLAAPPGPELRETLRHLRASLEKIRAWLDGLADESAVLAPEGDRVAELRAGEVRLATLSDQLRDALDLLERILAKPERVPLDAPYGLGAPRLTHPGAQATWAADRAEALAGELVTQSVRRENLSGGTAQTTR